MYDLNGILSCDFPFKENQQIQKKSNSEKTTPRIESLATSYAHGSYNKLSHEINKLLHEMKVTPASTHDKLIQCNNNGSDGGSEDGKKIYKDCIIINEEYHNCKIDHKGRNIDQDNSNRVNSPDNKTSEVDSSTKKNEKDTEKIIEDDSDQQKKKFKYKKFMAKISCTILIKALYDWIKKLLDL